MTFDESAQTKYYGVLPGESGGTLRGEEPLSNFNGQNPYGNWVLATEDNGSNDFVGSVVGDTIATGTWSGNKPVTRAEVFSIQPAFARDRSRSWNR
jgi:hypothetical protein